MRKLKPGATALAVAVERVPVDRVRAICSFVPFAHLSFFAFCLLLLSACAPQPLTVTREPATLRLIADDACAPLLEEMSAAYEQARPWVTVEFEVFNASMAERMLRAGEAELALLSWLEETGGEPALWSYAFAHDGVAIIVHPATPFAETGLAHLQQVFRGHVQEWDGVVLAVVSREEGSGTRAAFERAVMENHGVTPSGVVMPSSEAMIEHVARTPGAIGYASTLWLKGYAGSAVRVLPVEGVLPAPAALADHSYPLSHALYLAAPAEPRGEAREFAQWVLGPEGQAITGRLIDWEVGGPED
jgi:phosphate transport system substrate-binding protein